MNVIVYDFGSFSAWLAAIGSIGALFYAVYLSKKSNRIKLEIIIVSGVTRNIANEIDPYRKEICITNLGVRTVHIRSIETCKKEKRKFKTISKVLPADSPILASISQGEMFKYAFSLNAKTWDKDKKYYICISELSGKKYYKRLVP